MSQFLTLLKREHLEHKSAFFWGPIVVLALILIAALTAAPFAGNVYIEISEERLSSHDGVGQDGVGIEPGRDSSGNEARRAALGVIGLDVAGRTDRELKARLQSALRAVALPFYWVFLVITLFGCIACMHDERKDRSVLFWKSMPVSDVNTVLSKYVYLAWLAPIATIAVILVAQLFGLSVLSMFVEEGMADRVWSNSGLLTQIAQVMLGFLLNGLTLLPIIGWLLLASAWFGSVPLLWAIGIPFWFGIVEVILFESSYIKSVVAYSASMPALPRASMDGRSLGIGTGPGGFADQFTVLAQDQFWVGLIFGILFLAAAVYVRGQKNEI